MADDVFRVVAVCTGNLCRSPMIERVLAARLAKAGGDWFDVSSAGTLAVDGEPMQPYTAQVLQEAGYDADGFAARRLGLDLVADADLVVVAEARHRAAVLTVWPEGLGRVFALSELVALGAVADRARPAPSLAERARAAVESAASARARVGARTEDLPDPMGQRLPAYRRCLTAVEVGAAAVERLLAP